MRLGGECLPIIEGVLVVQPEEGDLVAVLLVHLLEREDPVERPDTAIFYAITSAQPSIAR